MPTALAVAKNGKNALAFYCIEHRIFARYVMQIIAPPLVCKFYFILFLFTLAQIQHLVIVKMQCYEVKKRLIAESAGIQRWGAPALPAPG